MYYCISYGKTEKWKLIFEEIHYHIVFTDYYECRRYILTVKGKKPFS
jgi:hypothetical protein